MDISDVYNCLYINYYKQFFDVLNSTYYVYYYFWYICIYTFVQINLNLLLLGKNTMEKLGIFKDYDGTIKTVCKEDDNYIEMTLLMNRDNTDVVCVPTHNYCNLGCTMCHLCNKSLNKEMIPVKDDAFLKALYYSITNKNMHRRTNNNKILLSFMGVGEPMLNLDLLFSIFMQTSKIKSFKYDEVGFAISTMMPNDNILKLADFVNKNNIPVKVHFSLHAPIDNIRKTLIPGAKFNIDECIKLLVEYKNIVSQNKIL